MNYKEQHKERHEWLHKALDELVADFIIYTEESLQTSTVMRLIKWSYNQTVKPTEE